MIPPHGPLKLWTQDRYPSHPAAGHCRQPSGVEYRSAAQLQAAIERFISSRPPADQATEIVAWCSRDEALRAIDDGGRPSGRDRQRPCVRDPNGTATKQAAGDRTMSRSRGARPHLGVSIAVVLWLRARPAMRAPGDMLRPGDEARHGAHLLVLMASTTTLPTRSDQKPAHAPDTAIETVGARG